MAGDVRKIGWLVGVEAHDKSAVAEVSVAALAVIVSVF